MKNYNTEAAEIFNHLLFMKAKKQQIKKVLKKKRIEWLKTKKQNHENV